MKGIIFNLLQEAVQLHHGPAVDDCCVFIIMLGAA
jgi:hypothetical protein